MKIKALLLILVTVALSARADKAPRVEWLESEYDFGLIKEEAGPRQGHVRLVNHGPGEAVVMGARPSCGCTGVEIPDEPIAPGDTAVISFEYNPLGRPGRFDKTISVYMGQYDTKIIRIRGNVLGTPESLSVLYPVEVGPLRFSESVMAAGEVPYDHSAHYFINAYNQTTDTIAPAAVVSDPSLSVSSVPEKIGPGEIVTFSLYFTPRDKGEVGNVEIPVGFVTDSSRPGAPDITIPFIIKVRPAAKDLSAEQLSEAPLISVVPQTVDLGLVKAAKELRFAFKVVNQGRSELHLQRVTTKSKGVTVKRYPVRLWPSKSGELSGTINPAMLEQGPFRIELRLESSDPLHPVTTLTVCGEKI